MIDRRTMLTLIGLAAIATPGAAQAAQTGVLPMTDKPLTMPDAQAIDLGLISVAGGVIRLEKDPDGYGIRPYIHANAAHYNAGIREVFITTSGDLGIRTDSDGRPIISCGVWMDETLGGAYGVTGGISGGIGISTVRLNRAGRRLNLNGSDGRAIGSGVSNLWALFVYGPKA